jgi:hypothetical protein
MMGQYGRHHLSIIEDLMVEIIHVLLANHTNVIRCHCAGNHAIEIGLDGCEVVYNEDITNTGLHAVFYVDNKPCKETL